MATRCGITNCKMTLHNKPPGVTFHACPVSQDMRNKWLVLLKNKCTFLDWTRTKICSRHFENKYFDSQRRLNQYAVPTLFPQSVKIPLKVPKEADPTSKTRIDKLISKQSQAELIMGIKGSMSDLKEPQNADLFVTDNLKCRPDAPQETQLWLLVKKQDHLITRLMEQISQHKKHVEVLQHRVNETRVSKREMDQTVESLKYVVKCLQEKHATLEEQVEILTAVESR